MFLYIQQSVTYFETFLSFVIDEDKYMCTASIFASAEEVIIYESLPELKGVSLIYF